MLAEFNVESAGGAKSEFYISDNLFTNQNKEMASASLTLEKEAIRK
jgi:hypothetical protein